MIMRRNLFLAVALLFSSVLTAATVTREEARQLALRFLTEHGSGVAAARGMQPVPLLLRDAASVEQLHVFNVGQQEGFVIVSGDDCTGDLVLGYADSGEIAQETMPDNLRAWLQGYADQIRWMQQHGVRNDVAAARALTSAARQPVASRMTCRWNQAEPYNMYCPLVNSESDERTVTGCEATAVAQVLYYHGMRLGGTTTTTKTIPGYTKGNYTIDDKEPYEFDWSKMEDSYAASDVSESAQEVARLMEYVGAGVYMKYNSAASGGSSANSEKIAPLLTEYFGYDKDAQLLIRNNYTYAEWVDLVYQELTQNGPVLYDGQSTGGGHIFVLDGYIDEDYFFVNWGWGGNSNGYFKLSVLYSKEQGIGGSTSQDGFCFTQEVMVNIMPTDNGIDDPVAESTLDATSTLTATMEVGDVRVKGTPIVVSVHLTNGANLYSGDVILKSGSSTLAAQQFEIQPNTTKDVVFSFTPTTARSYTLTLKDKKNNKLCEVSGVVVTDNGETTGELRMGADDVTLTNADLTANVYGTRVEGTATIHNDSETTAHTAGIYVRLYGPRKPEGGYPYTGIENYYPTNIPAQGSQTIDFELDGMKMGGAYKIAVKWDAILNTYAVKSLKGIVTYAADGTMTVTPPAASVVMGADDLALDITDVTGVETVTPNDNPNTLYIMDDETPAGLDGCNVVNSGVAEQLTLTDGHPFFSPVEFIANTATYTRRFTVGADGSQGWSTIVVPFDVTTVKQGEAVKDWFHSSSDTGKHFWLKEFVSESGNTVNFDFAEELKANTPYIIAVPGNTWGKKWDLTNKDITFSATNATVQATEVLTASGNNYKFVGTLQGQNIADSYQLNAEGTAFLYTDEGSVAPFRACFQPLKLLGSVLQLFIGSDDGTVTAIRDLQPTGADAPYYNLNGQRVGQPGRGLYVVGGKKVIIR